MLLDDSTSIPQSSHIEAGVYSNNPNTNYGSADRYLVGMDSMMGICRAYIKLNTSLISYVGYDNVLSANYRIRELTGYNTSFQAEAYMVKSTWAENTITWNNKPAYDNEKLTTVNVEWGESSYGTPGYYDFYITPAVMAWLQGLPNNGIMIKSRVEDNWRCRAFASYEYGNYYPQFTVKYRSEDDINYDMQNIGITNDTLYYLKNKRSGLYLTNPGIIMETKVTQTAYTGNANQQWRIARGANGYYTLVPQNVGGMYLDCTGILQGSYLQVTTFGNDIYFEMIRNWDGSFQILTRASDGVYAIKIENDSTTSGCNIIHAPHTVDWTKSDDWTLEPVIKGDAEMFTFTNTDGYGLDTYQFSDDVVNIFAEMGYNDYGWPDHYYRTAYKWLSDDQIWVFSGHGGFGCLDFKNEYITASIEDENNAAISLKEENELSKLMLAMYAGCNTGLDYEYDSTNLVGITYLKGAHFVVGTSDWTSSPYHDEWIEEFFRNCYEGDTIYEAMEGADQYIYETYNSTEEINFGNVMQRHCLGDNSIVLYHNN